MTLSDKEILEALRDDPGRAWTAGEIADCHDMSQNGIRRRLFQLDEEGELCCKMPNENTLIFWLPDTDNHSQLSK
jgi:response regulator of citrate/malate metabolism